jgi:hypothetical protein
MDIDVIVNTQPLNIQVNTVGIQGPPGPLTTASGSFYPLNTNPSGYMTSGNFQLWDSEWNRAVTISCVSGVLSVN